MQNHARSHEITRDHTREQVLELLADAEAHKQIEVDLPSQRVIRHDGTAYPFEASALRGRSKPSTR